MWWHGVRAFGLAVLVFGVAAALIGFAPAPAQALEFFDFFYTSTASFRGGLMGSPPDESATIQGQVLLSVDIAPSGALVLRSPDGSFDLTTQPSTESGHFVIVGEIAGTKSEVPPELRAPSVVLPTPEGWAERSNSPDVVGGEGIGLVRRSGDQIDLNFFQGHVGNPSNVVFFDIRGSGSLHRDAVQAAEPTMLIVVGVGLLATGLIQRYGRRR